MIITQFVYENSLDGTVLGATKCPITYHITDINQERSESFGNDYDISPNDGLTAEPQALTGIWDHTSGGEKDGYFWIRAVVTNVNTDTEVLVDETQFWVNITDPCIVSASIVAPSISIPDLEYVINGNPGATTHTVDFLHDQASDLYGYDQITIALGNSQDNDYHVCGQKTYGIYLDDQETPINSVDNPYITWVDSDHATDSDPTGIQISVYTTDPVYYTNANVQYWLKATLDNYIILYPDEATHWEPFNVNILNCQVTDYSFSDPTSSYQWDTDHILYNIYTPYQWIDMAEFTETVDSNGPSAYSSGCNYVPTYTVAWRNFYDTTLDLTYLDGTGDLIRWVNTLTPTDTTSLFRYEIYSSDVNDIDTTRQLYYLELTATISTSDMNPAFSKTQQI